MRYYLDNDAITFLSPSPGDAGYDIRCKYDIILFPKQTMGVQTGLHLEIPQDHVGIIKDRSSMAKVGIYTHGGVIDSAYRGEIIVLLENSTEDKVTYGAGSKIAQIIILRCLVESVERVDSLDKFEKSVRGIKGFGSTGKF